MESSPGTNMTTSSGSPMERTWLAKWGRMVHRNRGKVVVFSLVFAVGILAGGILFPGSFHLGGDPTDATEAGQTQALLESEMPGGKEPTFFLILSDMSRDWDSAGFRTDANATVAALRADPDVTSVRLPYDIPAGQNVTGVSTDGHRIVAVVSLNLTMVKAQTEYVRIRGLAEGVGGITTLGTGPLAIGADFQEVFAKDMPRAESISMPLTLIVLVVVFGAVVAAALPLGIGLLAAVGGVMLTALLAHVFDLPDWSGQLVSLICLGVAIDYCLFIVNRFREELANGRSREDALGLTMATSGHAILFSGLTVAVSLGGLAFFDGLDFAATGYAVAAGVAFAVFLAMTLLPALLAYLGPRINKWRIGRRKAKDTTKEGFWHSLAGTVMKRPILFSIGVILLVTVLAAPLAGIRFGGFSPQQLPPEFESREGADLLTAAFPSAGASEIFIALQWDDANPRSAASLGSLYDYSQAVAGVKDVVAVESLATSVSGQTRAQFVAKFQDPATPLQYGLIGGTVSVVKLHMLENSDSASSESAVRDVRELDDPPGSKVFVGGFTAFKVDTVDLIVRSLPIAVPFILGATYVILALQVRSLILPLKAVVMNLAFLNFTPTPLEPGNMVLMFCIVFGLSMDYEVLLLSRMHEAYLQTGDNRKAVQRGLESSGRIITGAALIMVLVFGAFGVIRITFMKVIGVGLAFAILFDATIIRAILVPALMRMMGKWNWWAPRWMSPAQPIVMAGMAVPAAVEMAPESNGTPVATPSTPVPKVAVAPRAKAPAAAPEPVPEHIQPSFADPAIQKWFEVERAKKTR